MFHLEIHKTIKEPRVKNSALEILQKYYAGEIYPKMLKKCKFKAFSIGRNYRLLQRKDDVWELLNHRDYNRLADTQRK